MSCVNQGDFKATRWPEADQLFRNDPFWVGGDDAYSISIGGDNTLWLFADTAIDSTGSHCRNTATLIRNSIGIQKGLNPSLSNIAYYWRVDNFKKPSSFFPEKGNEWLWPGHGIFVEDRLIIFLMRVRGIKAGLGFEVYDWEAVLIPNPKDNPLDWELRWLNIPRNKFKVIVGSASVFKTDSHIYAFCSHEGSDRHAIYVVRWPVEEIIDGNLYGIEWWDKSSSQWVNQKNLTDIPEPLFLDGQTEFTVHFEERSNSYICFQTLDFGPSNIYYRTAPSLIGPWSELKKIYTPPEINEPNIMIYAAKAHPHLTGSDIVLTYATNSSEISDLLNNTSLYYPRFIKIRMSNK
jgi:hypothetical protein